MNAATPAVICLSGGLDSTSLLLHLLARGKKVFGISFDYGQKHQIELKRLQANLSYFRGQRLVIEWNLVDLSSISTLLHSALTDPNWEVPTGHYESENMKQTVVPNRNAIFASIAFAQALSVSQKFQTPVDLCLGVHSGDHAVYPDCRPEFYEAIFRAFKIGNWDAELVELYLPYLEFDKFEILCDAQDSIKKLDLDFQTVFRNTITSYAPGPNGESSGMTGSDVERILAFNKLGIVDPIDYAEDWGTVVQRATRLEHEFKSSNSSN